MLLPRNLHSERGVRMRIVYNSFNGRYSDSPRAIFERLQHRPDLDHVWLGEDAHRAAFPAGTTVVDVAGPGARAALESADLVIASTHTEVDWDKQPGTTYLQTWHGTPLKRVHYDALWVPEGRLDYLDVDVAKWDLLLSPNTISTPRLRKAFGFDGEVLETGYPRNDLLSSPEVADVRARVRAELGIPDGVTTVLYAPTWRDDDVQRDTTSDVPFALEPQDFVDALGPDQVLLARAHNLATGRSRMPEVPGVHDVSYYPDVRDLYAAADVLVTDYSSVMFDFAITGRPIVFYAYDLDRFRDSIRGFYFDLLSDAPGPVVRTQEELFDALGRLPALTQEYAGRYATFRSDFTALEDGHATDRVLERLGLKPSL
jgi:CDP-glycerol glycerophosphotransferase